MIQPYELSLGLLVDLDGDAPGNTNELWEILVASRDGDIERVKRLVDANPPLIFGQYNYTPPIHFAVREGHIDLVEYLLENGAHDPTYKIYPFNESLTTIAIDRGLDEIAAMLEDYELHPERQRFKGDNGGIQYPHDDETVEFQRSIAKQQHTHVRAMLEKNSELAKNKLLFWGEGVLCRSANDPDPEMLRLLISYGATVPVMSKWGRAYYFKHYNIAKFLIEQGMDAKHHTWHNVTLLHDMAQEGDVAKAELLLTHGADVDAIDEEYCSTPLGLAAKWGHTEMVQYLLKNGADRTRSAAPWATPLAWVQKNKHAEIERVLSI